MNNIPDEQACIAKLADSTLAEADILANKLLRTSPEKNVEKNEGYYEALRSAVQSAQNTRDNHINAYCDLDGMRIYGGTGQFREIGACRYYYAQQYLSLLKGIEKDIMP
jgi:hypothetical protein